MAMAEPSILDAIRVFGVLGILTIISVAIYGIPTWIAAMRGHHNVAAIAATNVLLGWTVLGWIAALIWSLTAIPDDAN